MAGRVRMVTLKPRTPKGRTRPAKEVAEDLSVPVWVDPHLTPAFYKRLNAIASTCQVPRYQVLQEGIELFLKRYQEEQSLVVQLTKDKASAQAFRKVIGDISRKYWEGVSEKEKSERGKKAAQARWAKKKTDAQS